MIFDAKIKNVDEWKAVVNAIGDIVEDAMFICNDDGVTFRGTDPAHITLLDVTFPKSSFESLQILWWKPESIIASKFLICLGLFQASRKDILVTWLFLKT